MEIGVKTGIAVVIVMLAMIVLLLVERQEDRPRTLGRMLLVAVLAYFLCEASPFVAGLIALTVTKVKNIGWPATLRFLSFAGGISLAVFAVLGIAIILWLDGKDNRAIRAGSQEAFDRRVKEYVQTFGYSREKAIETTTRIRDSK